MRILIYALYLVVFAALALFSYQNAGAHPMNFAVWRFGRIPMWWPPAIVTAAMLVLALLGGAHIGIASRLRQSHLRRETRRRTDEAERLRVENAQLRAKVTERDTTAAARAGERDTTTAAAPIAESSTPDHDPAADQRDTTEAPVLESSGTADRTTGRSGSAGLTADTEPGADIPETRPIKRWPLGRRS